MRLLFLSLALAACDDPIVNQPGNTDTTTETGSPSIALSTNDLDFGLVAADASVDLQLVVSNTGGATLEVELSLLDPFESESQSFSVAPGGSSNLTIYYRPTDYGIDESELLISSNDSVQPELTVTLSGEVTADADQDGFDCLESGGTDCDDDDPDTNPDAEESWYDGVDQDCDGLDDYDQDQDGYQESAYNSDPLNGGGDCNDTNPAINPGESDTWYDNLDSDCGGENDWDADGDGYETTAGGHGSDCDDTNPLINPGAEELAGNGRDDDCDGSID